MTRISLGLEDDFANGMIAKQIIEIAKTAEHNRYLWGEGILKKLHGYLHSDKQGGPPNPPRPAAVERRAGLAITQVAGRLMANTILSKSAGWSKLRFAVVKASGP